MQKKGRYKRIAAVAAFFIVVGAALLLAGQVVRAKFIGDSTTIVDGFYAEKKDDIDVIVIGSSNSFCTIDPVVLYDNYGIAAYDFGSSSQPVQISLLYIKEALKRQEPKVIAFEVNMMMSDSISSKDEAGLRWGLTDMPLTLDKLECIYQSVGEIDAEYFSYVFPSLRYHSRWKELSKTDYTYFYSDKTNNTKGYLETQSVAETAVNLDSYDMAGDAWIDEENVACLDEIVYLCRKNGVELLLFKSPREGWHQYDTDAVQELAAERGLQFVDYNVLCHDGEVILDTATDFRDAQHLNDFGAEKVTMHFGAYLKEHYDLPDRRGEATPNSWDEASLCRRHKGWQDYMGAADAHECLELLQNDSNYIIMVTDSAQKKGKRGPEQWIYEDGVVTLHKVWDGNGVEQRKVGKSTLVLYKKGIAYKVLIDGEEYYQTGSRWNIIVYDKVTQEVKALAFDQ